MRVATPEVVYESPMVAGLLLALGMLLAAPASAIQTSLCKEDGVTETPSFAMGRDGSQCLELDPGNGDAPVKFQWEIFHKNGISETAVDSGESINVDIVSLRRGDWCGGKSDGCSFLMWDTVIDNYSTAASKNDDVLFFGQGDRVQYALIKDSVIANGWKCGGNGWSGPNGLGCASGEDSSAHSDGMQLRGQPVLDGWFILQDTVFVNGVNLHFLSQVSSEVGRTGSLVFQGGEVGRRQAVGDATRWVDDCEARSTGGSNADDICPQGRTLIDSPNREIWFIDVYGETRFAPKGLHDKIVVVQESGCGTQGCGSGSIQYHNGWPHPLDTSTSQGPGTCPNGSLGTFRSTTAYCYTSLEEAARDHKLPPFVQLSATGWANRDGAPTRPAPPELLPE